MLDIVEDVPRVLAAIVSAVAAGELPLEDAADLSKLVEGVSRPNARLDGECRLKLTKDRGAARAIFSLERRRAHRSSRY